MTETQIRIATWNLRYDSMPDSISVKETLDSLPGGLEPPKYYSNVLKEQPWSSRRVKVAKQLLNGGIVLTGLQEALKRQVDDLVELLTAGGQTYSYVGIGRDDGDSRGEFSPIFYDKSRIELLKSDTFWLSKTPFQAGSKFPGAGSVRICTTARFRMEKDCSKDTTISILNTHLDDQSEDQRRLGASLILHRAAFEALDQNGPVMLLGDFNSSMSGRSDSGAYRIITGAAPAMTVPSDFASRFPVKDEELSGFRMVDMRATTEALRISGNFTTFTGFKSPENSSSDLDRIDFIFGDSNMKWSSLAYEVPSCLSDDGMLASDHRPTFATVAL